MEPHPTSVEATAARLRLTREALKKRPTDICQIAGLATSRWSNWEAGDHRPQLEGAFKLCDAVGLTLDWIYRGVLAGVRSDVAEAIQRYRTTGQATDLPFPKAS